MFWGSSLFSDNFLAFKKYDFGESVITRTGSLNSEVRSNSGKK